jgi:ABC-2 type transport system permease protein
MVALNYVRSIVEQFDRQWIAAQGLTSPPTRLETRAWFNPNLESRWFFIPGLVGLLTLVVTMLVTALTVAREREQGTFDQLLVTPLRPGEILLGKALPGFLIGIVQGTLILLIATLWFKVPLLGSLPTLYAGLALFLLSAVGAGLLISSLAVTQQQGLLGAFLFMVPAVILSGFATPIANMPKLVQTITLIDPLRYFLVILRKVFLEGAGFDVLTDQLWPMAVIGVIALSLASWLFRHRMY